MAEAVRLTASAALTAPLPNAQKLSICSKKKSIAIQAFKEFSYNIPKDIEIFELRNSTLFYAVGAT